jgi:polyadenylate-binding protein 2
MRARVRRCFRQELEAMKARLKEMEDEAAKLRQMQARNCTGCRILRSSSVAVFMRAAADPASPPPAARRPQAKVEKEMSTLPGASDANREEVDARSVFVGNVDYAVTPEELQLHFQSCGTVNRVTILTDKAGAPKGYAYVEFLEAEAVPNAVLLNDSELHARAIKVVAKRTNVPGLKARRPGRGRGAAFGFPPPYDPWGGAAFYGAPGYYPPPRRPFRGGGRRGGPPGRGGRGGFRPY